MNNKGIGKVWFTKPLRFRIGAMPIRIDASFTLSQCAVGWIKLWHIFMIHLVFVTINIEWLPLKSKDAAKSYLELKRGEK